MVTSLKKRRRQVSTQPSLQDLLLALAKAVGTDPTQEYDPDTFSSMWVDLDEESYEEQGAYIHNLLQQLLNVQESTAIVVTERKTKVWFQHDLQIANLNDSDLVDSLLGYPTTVTTVFDADGKDLSFLAIKINND